jgi:hypothetical protein
MPTLRMLPAVVLALVAARSLVAAELAILGPETWADYATSK